MMNAFATAISIGLQYGVPLETFVRKFSYMRFDPEGMTTNPEIPFAKSLPDYIMRWLASRFLDPDVHEELGILTRRRAGEEDGRGGRRPTERTAGTATPTAARTAGPTATPTATRSAAGAAEAKPADRGADGHAAGGPGRSSRASTSGPACSQCGGMMQRTGQLLHVLQLRQQHRLRLVGHFAATRALV